MSFTAEFTHSMRLLDPEAFGTSGRTTAYQVDTLRMTGGTRKEQQYYTLSAGVSNVALDLEPITASDPAAMLCLATDQPLDLRLNASNASMLSAVRGLRLGASISAVFVTVPGSAAATLRVDVLGGGTVIASTPTP